MAKLKISDYLTVSEAAKILGVNPMTLRRWDNAGKVKAYRHPVSHYRLYLLKDIKSVLANVKRLPL
jgi:site-specific DNA-methyltransferase (adenine-specific)